MHSWLLPLSSSSFWSGSCKMGQIRLSWRGRSGSCIANGVLVTGGPKRPLLPPLLERMLNTCLQYNWSRVECASQLLLPPRSIVSLFDWLATGRILVSRPTAPISPRLQHCTVNGSYALLRVRDKVTMEKPLARPPIRNHWAMIRTW